MSAGKIIFEEGEIERRNKKRIRMARAFKRLPGTPKLEDQVDEYLRNGKTRAVWELFVLQNVLERVGELSLCTLLTNSQVKTLSSISENIKIQVSALSEILNRMIER